MNALAWGRGRRDTRAYMTPRLFRQAGACAKSMDSVDQHVDQPEGDADDQGDCGCERRRVQGQVKERPYHQYCDDRAAVGAETVGDILLLVVAVWGLLETAPILFSHPAHNFRPFLRVIGSRYSWPSSA